MYKNIILLIATLFGCFQLVFAQEPIPHKIYDTGVRSVQFYKAGNSLTYPFVNLQIPTPITLEFDEMTSRASTFYIKIIHCNADWAPSDLATIEYLDGLFDDKIVSFRHSQNTKKSYNHYFYQFPNQNVRLKVSGNYVLKVLRDNDENQVVMTRRFLVCEEQIVVQPKKGLNANDPSQRIRIQSVNFDIFPNRFKIFDPLQELKVQILQNFRWDNAATNLKPTYIYPESLEYVFNSASDFKGGSEFRRIDIRSMRRYGGEIDRIQWGDTAYYVRVMLEKPTNQTVYISNTDFNGNFFIQNKEVPENSQFEGDYAYVTFRLQPEEEYENDDVYLLGRFTDWELKEEFKMNYNRNKDWYETEVLLKQGFYDYHYVTKNKKTGVIDETKIEGSHVETENAYSILVYFKGITDRFDRLVAVKHINYAN